MSRRTRYTRLIWAAALLATALAIGLVRETTGHLQHQRDAAAVGRSELQARKDIAAGHLRVKEMGRIPLRYRQYQRLVQRRYGVEATALGDVVGPDWQAQQAYNRVVMNFLRHRYGRDVLAECRKKVATGAGQNPAYWPTP